MNQSSCDSDEDQDSLFGSPPPSPARGRSPSSETLVAGGETGPIIAVPSAGVGRKNVGTIALPGSHMSCAELPADLPASSLSLPCPRSNHGSPGVVPPNIAGTPTSLCTSAVTSRSSTRSMSSRASSATSTVPSASASTRKRRKPKSKSATPISPPIALPGPNEPTPPNFLRSQSSLLGLAGVVGCVKPAQLYTHDSKPAPVEQPRSHTPVRGSTPTHPIIIDDDQDTHTPPIGKRPISQLQVPQRLDQLDPELFRSNITNSLTKEKDLFPVLESLIKLLGGEPHLPSTNSPRQPFAQPYGRGVFDTKPSSSIPPYPTSGGSITATVPPAKRRKLKHVPAGAVDWDIPFPFAAGEGPEAYRNTWARDRAKQLVTQLLELVRNAVKRAAIKTVKTRGKVTRGQTFTQNHHSSRSTSVETQTGQSSSNTPESLSHTSPNAGATVTGTSIDGLGHHLDLLATPSPVGSSTLGSKDMTSSDSEGPIEEGSSAVPCDYSTFEEWLSQLQQFLPSETNTSTESDWDTGPLVPSDSSTSGPGLDTLEPMQHATRDEVIDPALLAISQQSGSAPQFRSPTSPTSTITLDDIPQILDVPPIPPAFAHSPRTSLSSLTEPLTPLSEAFADVPTSMGMITYQDPICDPSTHRLVEKDRPSRPGGRVQATELSSSLTEPYHPPRITAVQKGKARADGSVASATPSTSSRSTPSMVSTSKGALDKQAILECARERRGRLVAEIERAKVEMWEATIENAVLVHFTRDGVM